MSRSEPKMWGYMLAIVVAALVTHWPLMLNDGIYYDDWVNFRPIVENDFDSLVSMYSEFGLTLPGYYLWLFHYVPNPILSAHLVAFVSITVSALALFGSLILSGVFSKLNAFAVVAVFITLPVFLLTPVYTASIHLLCSALFFVGSCLWLLFEKRRVLSLRISALVCFFLSFNINSFLVFYGVVAATTFFVLRSRERNFLRVVILFLARRLDLVLLPIVYWVIKETYWPRSGAWASYNRIGLSLSQAPGLIHNFLKFGMVEPLQSGVGVLLATGSMGFLFALCAILFVILLVLYARRDRDSRISFVSALAGVGVSGLVYVLAILPYVLVGKAPSSAVVETRHALLTPLPVALFLLSLMRMLTAFMKNGIGNAIVMATIGLSSCVGWLGWQSNYMAWQTRWAKDRAVMQQLKKVDASRFEFYWIQDDFPVHGCEMGYGFYEYTTMFRLLWGGQGRLAMTPRHARMFGVRWLDADQIRAGGEWFASMKPHLRNYTNAADFKLGGAQVAIVISPQHPKRDNSTVFWEYLSLAYFGTDSEMRAYLDRMVRVDLVRL